MRSEARLIFSVRDQGPARVVASTFVPERTKILLVILNEVKDLGAGLPEHEPGGQNNSRCSSTGSGPARSASPWGSITDGSSLAGLLTRVETG